MALSYAGSEGSRFQRSLPLSLSNLVAALTYKTRMYMRQYTLYPALRIYTEVCKNKKDILLGVYKKIYTPDYIDTPGGIYMYYVSVRIAGVTDGKRR